MATTGIDVGGREDLPADLMADIEPETATA
jgi:hypothetical protein